MSNIQLYEIWEPITIELREKLKINNYSLTSRYGYHYIVVSMSNNRFVVEFRYPKSTVLDDVKRDIPTYEAICDWYITNKDTLKQEKDITNGIDNVINNKDIKYEINVFY